VKPPGTRLKVLLTVARLSTVDGHYKGIDKVINVLPRVIERVGDVQYVVAGDGDERPRLEALARSTGVSDHVRFLGRISDADLFAQYRDCDVFVMPSSGEGFGIVFLEAMAFGKPVIGGDHGGTPDVVRDGVNGYLVKHDDEDALATRIIQLLGDENLCASMGAAGLSLVNEEFTPAKLSEKFLNLLSTLA